MKVALVLALLAAPCAAFAPLARTGGRAARAPVVVRSEEAGEAAAEPAAAAAPRPRRPRGGKPLTDFEPEMVVDGEVKAVMKYGAFVDIGAASDGLVHISQLAEGFVSDPTTIVSVGDKVTVRVLSIDTAKNQLALSMKEKGADGGGRGGRGGAGGRRGPSRAQRKAALEGLADADPKAFVTGVVADIQPFGAFVTIDPGVDGLVHISRLSEEHVDDVSAVVAIGQEVQVRVTEVDVENGKLALAMTPWVERASNEYTGGGGYAGDDGYALSSGPRNSGDRRNDGEDGFGGGRPRGGRPRGRQNDEPQSLEDAFNDNRGARRIDSGLGVVKAPDLVEAGFAADYDWESGLAGHNGGLDEKRSESTLGQIYFDREEGIVKMAGLTRRMQDA